MVSNGSRGGSAAACRVLVAVSWAVWLTGSAWAGAAYTGGLGIDTFDGLPSEGSFTLPTGRGPYAFSDVPVQAPGMEGWSVYANGSGGQVVFRVGSGSSTTSGVWSFGLTGDADRALGSLSSGGHEASLAFVVENQTGEVLTRFYVSVTGEQWRRGNGGANTLTFDYVLGSGDITAATGTAVAALNFTAPVSSGAVGALNGNDPANRVVLDAEVTGLIWAPGTSLMLRWRDEDDSGNDDGLALDDFLFHAPRAVEPAPTVVRRFPGPGATLIGVDEVVEVLFDQPVTLGVGAFSANGSVSGSVPVSVSGGPFRYVVTPTGGWMTGETVTVSLSAAQVQGVSTPMAADEVWTFETFPSPGTLVPIHTVQGTASETLMEGADLMIEGVVVGDFQGLFPALGGFFVQEEDVDADGDPFTSEGLFVYDADSSVGVDVMVGDVVRVRGIVGEFEGMTQMSGVTSLQVIRSGETLPSAVSASLPVAAPENWERFEGMRTHWTQALYVTDNGGGLYFQDRYFRHGELVLSSGGPLRAPTDFLDPNDDPPSGTSSVGQSNVAVVLAGEDLNGRNQIVLDDGSRESYPDPTPYLNGEGTRRCGDCVTGLAGVLMEASGVYRVQPTGIVSFVDANPRPAGAPAVGGQIRVAAMNVLNYFTTLGERGADTLEELERQRAKVVAALIAMDADAIGLIEIENTPGAVADLLAELNSALGSAVYEAAADPPEGAGMDAIRLAWFYKKAVLRPWREALTDLDAIWNAPDPVRPPLAQVFEEVATGERFIACLNHFKSKSNTGATGSNADQGDGQAAFNEMRRQQAARLLVWMEGVKAVSGDNDVLVIGDLNAHGEEDPIDRLRAGGLVDESERFVPGDYSYRLGERRGRLDHAFATVSMSGQITGVAHWHINADEPGLLDYNTEEKSGAQAALGAGTPYRSSDHDPVLVGITLTPQPTTFAMWAAAQSWPLGADSSTSGDPDGDGVRNLAEFVLNLNPLVSDSDRAPSAQRVGDVFELDFRWRTTAQGVTVIPKWSENLADWFPMSAVSEVSTVDAITKGYRAAEPVGQRGQMFGRLEILGAP